MAGHGSQSAKVAEELREVVGTLIRRMRAEPAGQDLAWSQRTVLRRLDREGPMTTADLARAELMTPQTMGALVADLEDAGYTVRTDDTTDGRRRFVSLTAAGRKILAAGRAARQSWLDHAIDAKLDTSEQRELLGALALLRRLVEP